MSNNSGQQIAIGKNIAQAWGPGASASVTVYEFAPPAPVDAETLAAARELLAQMPTDDVPLPASLPPGSRMPYTANPHFVGRKMELCELARLLKSDQTAVINQVAATGLGGIGKTQLAAAFVQRYGQYFVGGIHWLSLADPAAVPAEVVQCGLHMNLRPDFGQLKLDEQVPAVLSAWQSDLPRLLIFDNCEDEELLTRWRPPHGGCRLLITSRRSHWSLTLDIQPLPLPTLPRAISIDLLHKFRPELVETEANEIAAELGDLPLALHLAGSFLARYQYALTPQEYLEQLRDQALLEHDSLQGRGADFSPTGHDLHVARTFALSYDKLDPTNETDILALVLLGRAACLAPGESIPRALLFLTVTENEQTVETKFDWWQTIKRLWSRQNQSKNANHKSKIEYEDALARLVELGLLDNEAEGSLRLHRLLVMFIELVQPGTAARSAVEKALMVEAGRLNVTGYPAPLLAWQPHLRAVTDVAERRADEMGADLCSVMGYHLHIIGDYAGSHLYLERALVISEKVLGPEHPDTATSLNNLAVLLQDQGDYAGALPYLERALVISEKVLGPEHPETATCLNNLAVLFQAQGDYAGALPYHERALAISQKVLGPEHPDTAQSLNNLAVLLKDQGDYAGAKPYLEQALAISQKVLGPEHPDTAQSLNNLAVLLKEQGDYAGALPYLERALAIREKVLGPEHPDTAMSYWWMGLILRDKADLAGAQFYLERALAIYETQLESDHPYIQMVRDDLSALEQTTER